MKNCIVLSVCFLLICSLGSSEDLLVSGTSLLIDADREIDGSIFVENGAVLTIRNATVTLILDYDEEHHIDVSDNSQLIIDNSVIRSVGGQFWFELYGDGTDSPTMTVSGDDTWLTNHSGIRPFDQTRIVVTGGDVEELQVRDQVEVELTDSSAYPVFFFDNVTAQLSGLYTDVDYTVNKDLDFRTSESWRFNMVNSWIEGYQIDLKNGADVQLNDSDGVVLSMHTPGDLGPDLKIVEGLTADTRIAHGMTSNLGTRFEFTDCNIALINVYVFGSDRILLRNMHINEVNAEAGSELFIGGAGSSTRLNCNLCQVYDHAIFTVDSAIIDGTENVPSATAAFGSSDDIGTGVMTFREMDLRDLFLTVIQSGTIRVHNSTYDSTKLSVLDTTAVFEEYSLAVDFSATPVSGTAPLSVAFTDLSTGDIVSHNWDFGDGSNSTQQNPVHTYATEGVFTVSLTVTGPAGSNVESKSGLVNVSGVVQGDCGGDAVFVAAAAHADGAENSTWRSDLSVFNAADTVTNLAMKFFAKDQDNSQAVCLSVSTLQPWTAADTGSPGRSGSSVDCQA